MRILRSALQTEFQLSVLNVGSEACVGQEFPDLGCALLRFSLEPIPPGQVLQSATLQLYQRFPSGVASNGIGLHQVTGPAWEEATATWNNQPKHSPAYVTNERRAGHRRLVHL